MNIEKISKTIRRELARSPKKSALLGVMTLVAIYFWVPIIGGWLGWGGDAPLGGDTATSAGSITIASPQIPPPTPTTRTTTITSTTEPSVRSKQHPWKHLNDWIGDDPDMKPASWNGKRHPFVDLQRAEKLAQDAVKQAEQQRQADSVALLDLQLTNTLIGSRTSLATINGMVYREGERLQVLDEQAKQLISSNIYVRKIQRNTVILFQEGNEHSLTLPKADLSAGDRVHTRRSR